MSRGRTYLLVHGAWFGGWVWQKVAEGLHAAGHTVHAPSLTGLGDRKHLLRSGIDLETHATDIVNLIEMEDLRQVVLVGWSYGGMVTTDVLARVPQRVASMVYLDAFAPERGRSTASYVTRNNTEAMMALVAQGKDIPPISIPSLGISDPAMVEHAMARVSPHPVMTFLQPSSALPQRPDIPHTYVLAGAYVDTSPTFRQFHEVFEKDPRADSVVMNTGHAMMLTDVEATVDLLRNVR